MEKVFIQIGTNDGNDEFNAIVRQNNPSTIILVEPNPSLKEKILENYKDINNVQIEIAAITTEKGDVELHIPIGDENGISENGIEYSDQHFTLIPMDTWGEKFITIKSKGITISDLFEKYNIKKVDYLQIDTEGYDYEIIKSIPFEKVDILSIKYENWPFDEIFFKRYGSDSKKYGKNGMYIVEEFLKSKGFTINNIGQDTIANKL